VFGALGRATVWLGPAGHGTRAKLVLNSWLVDLTEATAETLAFARHLGLDPAAIADLEAAADADMATVGAKSVVAFTHPLLASAIYDAAAPAERRRAHRVLANSLEDPVERARHRSRSIIAPDETVAGELERAAEIS
jgi:hypothetical protein